MNFDQMGDKLKAYESVETSRRLDAKIPIYARIDGRGFSKFTRDAIKPFDPVISAAMVAASSRVLKETKALLAYTQSDEISVAWLVEDEKSQMFFDGKVQKLCSVIAGIATSAFMHSLINSDSVWADRIYRMPHFDARVCNIPTKEECTDMFMWREIDARKNAISMAARAHFSHNSLDGLSGREKLEKLREAEVDFDAYPEAFRRGTYVRRTKVDKVIEEDARLLIPAHARPERGATVTRSVIAPVQMPPLSKMINREDVIFSGAEPIVSMPV